MAYDIWLVEKESAEDGYSNVVDITESFEDAVEVVIADWSEGTPDIRSLASWLSEPVSPEGYLGLSWSMFEYLCEGSQRLIWVYHIGHWVKE